MTEFDMMEETVERICWSLENEPDKWTDKTNTLDGYGFRLWKYECCFSKVWTGHTTEEVFSKKQALRIYKSYQVFKENNASESQKKIINALHPKIKPKLETEVKPKKRKAWWEFLK